jgi:hypothetical protein
MIIPEGQEKEFKSLGVIEVTTTIIPSGLERINLAPKERSDIETKLKMAFTSTLKNMLGVDLAGYFEVDVTQHKENKITKVQVNCIASTIAVELDKDPEKAFARTLVTKLCPTLRHIRDDLDKVISVVPKEIEKYAQGGE